MKFPKKLAVVALLCVLVAAVPALADHEQPPVSIFSAAVSPDQTTLFITGSGFGTAPPHVVLDGIALAEVMVSGDGSALMAKMPVLNPGTYLLMISRDHGDRDHDLAHHNEGNVGFFIVTVGAVGPKGDRGEIGPPGAPGQPGTPGIVGLEGKSCPTGQAVIGFDASGGLICAAFPPCSLINSQASIAVSGGGTASRLVKAGSVEFNPAPQDGRFSVDVEGSSVKMFNNTVDTKVTFGASDYTITFIGAPVIVDAKASIDGITDFMPLVSFTANSVTFLVSGSTWAPGSSMSVALQFACQ